MPRRVIRGSGRSGEDEEARALTVINLSAHLVPDGGLDLPFIEEDWGRVVEQSLGSEREKRPCGFVLIEVEGGLGLARGCGRLAAGLRALDQHCSHVVEALAKLVISDARKVGGHAASLPFACIPLDVL